MYNVLVVEDDPITADLMTMVLMRMPGLLVDAVGTAGHAREALASGKHYSMIITDVHLPGEDGLSLAKSIPEMPGRSMVPVIVVSSETEERIRDRGVGGGRSCLPSEAVVRVAASRNRKLNIKCHLDVP